MPYTRLSLIEREELAQGLARGDSLRQIARDLGRSPSTLSRELKRTRRFAYYSPAAVHAAAYKRARFSHRRAKLGKHGSRELTAYVMRRLKRYWSPEQISASLKREYPDDASMQLSHETIYRYIYLLPVGTLRPEIVRYLRQHKHKRKPKKRVQHDNRGIIPEMISIEERPSEVADRTIPGHWESDLLMGSLNRSALGTIVERTTRSVLLVPLPQHDAEHVRQAFAKKLVKLPERLTLSLTHDRGWEMAQHREFTMATKIKVYFAHPHSPWERGTSENTNGLIRQFFPKGTDFTKVSRGRIKEVEDLLNTRPRKVLEWKTPKEEFTKLLLH